MLLINIQCNYVCYIIAYLFSKVSCTKQSTKVNCSVLSQSCSMSNKIDFYYFTDICIKCLVLPIHLCGCYLYIYLPNFSFNCEEQYEKRDPRCHFTNICIKCLVARNFLSVSTVTIYTNTYLILPLIVRNNIRNVIHGVTLKMSNSAIKRYIDSYTS